MWVRVGGVGGQDLRGWFWWVLMKWVEKCRREYGVVLITQTGQGHP